MVRSFWMRNPLLQKNWWNSFFPTCKRKGGQRPWGYFCWGIFKWHFHRTDFLYTFNPPKGTWWKWIPMRMKHGAQQYSYTHLCVRDPIHIIYTCGVCLHNVYITKYTYNMYIYIYIHIWFIHHYVSGMPVKPSRILLRHWLLRIFLRSSQASQTNKKRLLLEVYSSEN